MTTYLSATMTRASVESIQLAEELRSKELAVRSREAPLPNVYTRAPTHCYLIWIHAMCWLPSDRVAINCQTPTDMPVALVSRLNCHWLALSRN